ncbi:HD domain-containing protein, partial [bacterium]|nr:HD domain-containing protein [bacterium]
VGGAIRELALGGSEIIDFDLVMPQDPTLFSSDYARKKKAGYVALDDEHSIARIVRMLDGVYFTLDLAKFRGPTIEADLKARDFTINSMAVELSWPLLENEFPVFDPLDGWKDLEEKRIVPCSDGILLDDPLRIMRAFRLAAHFDASISSGLLEMIKSEADRLKDVSPERIRDELFKIFSSPKSSKWVRFILENNILKTVIPELYLMKGVEQNKWHHLDVFEHTIETYKVFEEMLSGLTPFPGWDRFKESIKEHIAGTRTFEQVLKFVCLLHDIGKPSCKSHDQQLDKITFHGHEMVGSQIAQSIAQRLKLSSAEVQFIHKVVKNHMRPGLLIQGGMAERALFRYFSETGRDGLGIALLSLADRKSSNGPQMQNENPEEFVEGIKSIFGNF